MDILPTLDIAVYHVRDNGRLERLIDTGFYSLESFIEFHRLKPMGRVELTGWPEASALDCGSCYVALAENQPPMRAWRARHVVTQKWLAKKLGISERQVQNLDLKPELPTLYTLALERLSQIQAAELANARLTAL